MLEDQLFRLLVEHVTDYAIYLLDPRGHVASWNPGARRFKGYEPAEIIGRHFSVFYPRADVDAGKCEMELEVATATGRFEDEGWRVRKDGSLFWANVVITALRDPAGTLVGFGKVTRDLSDRRRAELEAAGRLVAEERNRVKDEFLAMLGHELRNPLAPLTTAVQLLRRRGNSRELDVIDRQVAQMAVLVDDLLDVSRFSRGELVLERLPIDVRDALATAVEIAAPMIEDKGHRLEWAVPAGAFPVSGDRARLAQVFANLLTNAAKYTPDHGRITITLAEVDGHIVVEVADDGSGLDAQLLPRVFELFVQGYRGIDRAEGGLGVGLTLVRALVGLHDGEVEARSDGVGLGSTFTVRLPRGPAPVLAVAEIRTTAPVPERKRILLVDDNEDARTLLAEMLEAYGHEIVHVNNGDDALELLRTYHPDVAILDIGLPRMDGYELARKICALPDQRVLLFALTGYGQRSDIQASIDAGFAAHLVKPLDVKRLLRLLDDKP